MDIKELKNQRRELEIDLATIISQKLAYFKSIAGISISSIDVHLISIQTIDYREADYIVGDVT